MPLERCQRDGLSGWRWGNAGKCYTGSDGKKLAIKQAVASGEADKIGEHVMPAMNRLVRITERIYGDDKAKVDRDAGVIRGVKILGRDSKNGRRYTESAMNQAAAIYEGLGVNFDHRERDQKTRDRKFSEAGGWLESVTVNGDGVYGDLHIIKSHPSSGILFETAERHPSRFGLSHDADGTIKHVAGKAVVESIEKVHSVDIVQNPATNRSLFESEELPVQTTIRKIVEGIDKKHDSRKWLLNLLEMDFVPDDTEVDLPAGDSTATPDADTQVKDAFRAMIVAAFDDEKLDSKATLAKIKEILAAHEKLTAKPEKPEPEKPAEEKSMATKESIDAERKDREARAEELLEAASIKADPKNAAVHAAKIKALAALSESKERAALIESWRPVTSVPIEKRVQKPLHSRPLIESGTVSAESVKDGKSLAAAILHN